MFRKHACILSLTRGWTPHMWDSPSCEREDTCFQNIIDFLHEQKATRVNFSMHIFATFTSLRKRGLLEAPNIERFFHIFFVIQLTWRVFGSTTNRKQEFEISAHLFCASRVSATKRVFHTIFTLGIAFGTVESNMPEKKI